MKKKMETTFGPWEACLSNDGQILADERTTIIGTVQGLVTNDGGRHALLITKAPEMLGALKNILDACNDVTVNSQELIKVAQACLDAKRLIAEIEK